MDSLKVKELSFSEFPPIATEEWEALIQQDLKGKNYKEVLRWDSGEGVQALPFYRKEHLEKLNHLPNPVCKTAAWEITETIEADDTKTANRYGLNALEQGASDLLFNLPADAVSSRNDLEQLLENIRIENIQLGFGANLSNPKISGWLREICKSKNLDIDSLNVAFLYDPFAYSVLTGKLEAKTSIQNKLDEFGDFFNNCAVNSSVFANSGATIVQQLAFALAAGNEYLGMNKELAQSIHFNFSTGPSYFPEIAKFRAFKLLWKQVLQEYGMEDTPVTLHAETALWNKSQTDAHNNMLRTTTEAMSAALGGCDAITVHRYDKHFAKESGFASRIARNTQLLLQEEAYLDKVADPGAGSYYIEVLTNTMAEESWKLFREIEDKGGFVECLKSGFIQSEIKTSRKDKINAYREKKEVLVGVNKYQPGEIKDLKLTIEDYPGSGFKRIAFTEIEKVEPLNIEAELQKGDA